MSRTWTTAHYDTTEEQRELEQFVRHAIREEGVAAVRSRAAFVPGVSVPLFLSIAGSLGVLRHTQEGGVLGTLAVGATGGTPSAYRSGASSSGYVPLHTEHSRDGRPPRYLGFLCERPAESGGATLLGLATDLWRVLNTSNPAAAQRLRDRVPVMRHVHDPDQSSRYDLRTVFISEGDRLTVCYPRYWIERCRVDGVSEADGLLWRAVDAIDRAAASPDVLQTLSLARGDMVFLDNTRVLHGRTAFYDNSGETGRTLHRVLVD